MHRLNVLIYASDSFVSTLNELRPFLKFNHFTTVPNTGYDIILFHDEVLKDKKIKNLIDKSDLLKVCVSNNKNTKVYFKSINELNQSLALKELSMGMSADYLDEIQYGATFVRIGSSIFGSRSQK